MVMIRLTRKLADAIDGVDLSNCRVGQVLRVPGRDAWLLLAEGCAERVEEVSLMRRLPDGRNFG